MAVTMREMFKFFCPLFLSVMVTYLAEQVINDGIDNLPDAEATLASFGLSYPFVRLAAKPLEQTKQLGLSMVYDVPSRRLAELFTLISTGVLLAVLLVFSISPASTWVFNTITTLPPAIAETAKWSMFVLSFRIILTSVSEFYSGILLKHKHTKLVSFANTSEFIATIAFSLASIPVPFIRANPILLPIIATYAGGISKMVIVLFGFYRFTSTRLTGGLLSSANHVSKKRSILSFFWPLALTAAGQALARPVINIFVASETGSEEALAALTIVFPLASIFYGWLNELKSLPPMFKAADPQLNRVKHFCLLTTLVSAVTCFVLFTTPLRDVLLKSVLTVPPILIPHCVWPLSMYFLIPLALGPRAYLQGKAIVYKKVKMTSWGLVGRTIGLFLAMLLLPLMGVYGATRGTAAFVFSYYIDLVCTVAAVQLSTPSSSHPEPVVNGDLLQQTTFPVLAVSSLSNGVTANAELEIQVLDNERDERAYMTSSPETVATGQKEALLTKPQRSADGHVHVKKYVRFNDTVEQAPENLQG
eukprot:GILJ01011426.1.p1 GENE.GILJ01011426.1~~GILJ01011426.1.p1  ORF type:complete len:532 (+),score=75.49 GILJ01011426.1:112-1707(+)